MDVLALSISRRPLPGNHARANNRFFAPVPFFYITTTTTFSATE